MNRCRGAVGGRLLALALLGAVGCMPPPRRPSPLFVVVDAEQRAAAQPDSLELPARERRAACKVGDLVKIILELPPGAPPREYNGERPWLSIQEVKPGPVYVGKLENDLVVFTELPKEQRIEFGPEHIIQVHTGQDPK